MEGQPQSHSEIKSFIEFYKIDMSQFEPSDPEAYTTFEDFFIRKHAPGARPIYDADDPTKAVIVSDSRVVVYPTVEATRRLWIKGNEFTIANLIRDADRAKRWEDGAVASFRLSPQDYHRYHSPVEGTVKWFKAISGDYYQVDPVALQSSVNILTENARCCVCIESKEFGDVLFVAIGATDVGTVEYVFWNSAMCRLLTVDIESMSTLGKDTTWRRVTNLDSSSSEDRVSSWHLKKAGFS